jgi:hypothetical protein
MEIRLVKSGMYVSYDSKRKKERNPNCIKQILSAYGAADMMTKHHTSQVITSDDFSVPHNLSKLCCTWIQISANQDHEICLDCYCIRSASSQLKSEVIF